MSQGSCFSFRVAARGRALVACVVGEAGSPYQAGLWCCLVGFQLISLFAFMSQFHDIGPRVEGFCALCFFGQN